MYWAMGVEPTKLSAATSGCSSKPSTTTLSPCTTLNTPSGRPACLNRSAISSERSEEHTSELQSLMRISYAVFCLKKKNSMKTSATKNTNKITRKQETVQNST